MERKSTTDFILKKILLKLCKMKMNEEKMLE